MYVDRLLFIISISELISFILCKAVSTAASNGVILLFPANKILPAEIKINK